MSIHSHANRQNSNWTTEKLISLSKNLGQGYNPGVEPTELIKSEDSWSTKKFVEMSRYLSSAYGVDF